MKTSRDALIVIDPQNDFCPGGSLAVPGGDEIMLGISELARSFETVIVTKDWHPAGHSSFATTHGKPPFSTIPMPYGEQVLWPEHCVHGTQGAELHSGLDVPAGALTVRKGANPTVDSYSAFYENDHETATGLTQLLKDRDIRRIFLTGLALDFCVAWSAIDGAKEGFEVIVLEDLTRAIDLNGSLAAAKAAMQAAGVTLTKVAA